MFLLHDKHRALKFQMLEKDEARIIFINNEKSYQVRF